MNKIFMQLHSSQEAKVGVALNLRLARMGLQQPQFYFFSFFLLCLDILEKSLFKLKVI
jgi:hypothetical protein